jgi:hypothetical protein
MPIADNSQCIVSRTLESSSDHFLAPLGEISTEFSLARNVQDLLSALRRAEAYADNSQCIVYILLESSPAPSLRPLAHIPTKFRLTLSMQG